MSDPYPKWLGVGTLESNPLIARSINDFPVCIALLLCIFYPSAVKVVMCSNYECISFVKTGQVLLVMACPCKVLACLDDDTTLGAREWTGGKKRKEKVNNNKNCSPFCLDLIWMNGKILRKVKGVSFPFSLFFLVSFHFQVLIFYLSSPFNI